jgi:hypothetical protein
MNNKFIASAQLTPEDREILKDIIRENEKPGMPVTISDALRIALAAWKERNEQMERENEQ